GRCAFAPRPSSYCPNVEYDKPANKEDSQCKSVLSTLKNGSRASTSTKRSRSPADSECSTYQGRHRTMRTERRCIPAISSPSSSSRGEPRRSARGSRNGAAEHCAPQLLYHRRAEVHGERATARAGLRRCRMQTRFNAARRRVAVRVERYDRDRGNCSRLKA